MPVLYHLTLQKPSAVVSAAYGNFSAPRAQEIVVSRGRVLELLRPDEDGKVHSVCSADVFGLIRSIAAFRLTGIVAARFPGAMTDYIVLGSDSGRLVIVAYNGKRNCFERVHCETFGKTGIRRVVAGEFVAVDPRGRAVMTAAVERQKFVYVLNRDSKTQLTISSPLEAHKARVVCLDCCGVDVGFDNPLFATIEMVYQDEKSGKAQQSNTASNCNLVFWEMDLGLNQVTKKNSSPLPSSAHALIPIPGGQDGPSGVIVCVNSVLLYKKIDHEDVACAIPRRLEVGAEGGLMIVAFAVHRMKGFFFVLIQSEYGDIYKIELVHDEGLVREVKCSYFETLPVCTALCVLKSGYLFAAAESGDHLFYQFTGIGADESDPRCTSTHPLGSEAIIAFKPRAAPKNLSLSDEMHSLAPSLDLRVLDAQGTGSPQLYVLCGRGPRSSLRILQQGLSVEELADNELPGRPRGVWTLKASSTSVYDGLIVVGFEAHTLVLQIGEAVEEVGESLFETNAATLHCAQLANDSYIQVLENELRHLPPGGGVWQTGQTAAPSVWRPPGARRIRVCASSERQVAVGLSGGELVLFELDAAGTLEEIASKNLSVETTALSIQPTPKGGLKGSFLAVGGLDNCVRVLSLQSDKLLKQLATQMLPSNATPESVCLAALQTNAADDPVTFLYVGLSTGVLLRCSVDPVTGALSEGRARFLGGRAPRLFSLKSAGNSSLIALSSKTWMLASGGQKGAVDAPLLYDTLESIASFASEQCPDGFVAVSSASLRIFKVNKVGDVFSDSALQLSYTPRAMAVLPHHSTLQAHPDGLDASSRRLAALAICEADHNAYDEQTKLEIRRALKGIKLNQAEGEEITEDEELHNEAMTGTFKAGPGKWGSCIRVVNPLLATTLQKVPLETDEAAVSCACVLFDNLPVLVVGTVTGMQLRPRKVPSASIRVYSYDNNFNLTLLHTTPVEDVPQCFAPFRGMLLCGVGPRLRLYALGRKRLLKKCEFKSFPSGLVFLKVDGNRIFAGDLAESIHVVNYIAHSNTFQVVCDDTGPRWLTRGEVLDHHTIIAADKFDSLFISRVPSEVRQQEMDDESSFKLKGDTAYKTDKCHKLQNALQFHVGDMVTGLAKAALVAGGSESVVYSTILGSIGVLVPFLTKEELDFFHHLEMAMRNEAPPLAGRDHLMFRSYYHPLKNVVDGDLCEQFGSLPPEVQQRLATDFQKSPGDIAKRLEDIRNRVL